MHAVFYVGSYSDRITKLEADFRELRFSVLQECGNLKNPSYLLWQGTHTLFAVEENGADSTVARLDPERHPSPITRSPTGGSDACHISADDEGQYLFVSNYTGGSLAVFRAEPLSPTSFIQFRGKGPNPTRQESPHIHFSLFHENLVFLSDLGQDRVFLYSFDRQQGRLGEAQRGIELPPGSGPRHFAFNPRFPHLLYVVCELDSSLCVCDWHTGRLLQHIPTLPAERLQGNWPAAVRIPDPGWLVCSNRGDDSLSLFSIGEDGLLTYRDRCSSGGVSPRDFQAFGPYLVTANQGSNSLCVLRLDAAARRLVPLDMSHTINAPVCICPQTGTDSVPQVGLR